MDVAVIDWKDSNFEKDDVLENINAPQWVDLSVPDESVDDEAWFCRPDCNHPKTIDDFLKVTPTSKLQRSASVSEILPFGDRNRRDAALKKRGPIQPSISGDKETKMDRMVEDGENLNPNLSTPSKYKAKFIKETIKSSSEKKKQVDNILHKEETPKLKSTLSARNLLPGKDILNHITDFCTELKRLAMRARERENVEKENADMSPVAAMKLEVKEFSGNDARVLLDERKPLLEVSKEKHGATENFNVKEKLRRKKKNDDSENTPICVDLKSIRNNEENLAQIRTNPPTPQCFSANHIAMKTATPRAFRARTQERGILQELEQSNKDVRKEEPMDNVPMPAEREAARTLDVFWFLKPCTLTS